MDSARATGSKFFRTSPRILQRIFYQTPNFAAAKLFAAVYNEVKESNPASKHCYRITIARFFADLGLVVDEQWDLRELGAAAKYGTLHSALALELLKELVRLLTSTFFFLSTR